MCVCVCVCVFHFVFCGVLFVCLFVINANRSCFPIQNKPLPLKQHQLRHHYIKIHSDQLSRVRRDGATSFCFPPFDPQPSTRSAKVVLDDGVCKHAWQYGKRHEKIAYNIQRSRFSHARQTVCLLSVGCLTSQQQASVSQGRICSDNFTCCHAEIEVADQTARQTDGPTRLITQIRVVLTWIKRDQISQTYREPQCSNWGGGETKTKRRRRRRT